VLYQPLIKTSRSIEMSNDNATIQLQLRKRQSQLESSATAQKSTISFAKTVGLAGGVGAAWMLAIANPAVAAAAAIVGAANYYASTTAETKKVGEFRPLLGRKSLSALAMGLDRRTVILDPIASIEDDVLYLGDDELGEWILLSSARAETAQFLAQFPPDKWDEAIELAARECYRTYGYLFRQDAEARARMRHERVGLHTLSAVKGEAQCLLADAAIAPAPAIGAATQLGAIPVQAVGVEVDGDESRPEAIAPQDGPLSVLLANPYQNRLIFGGQRTGKSFLAAIATRYLASKGIKVFHLNLSHTRTSEGRDEDAEYWQHATASIRFDLGALDSATAKQVIEASIKMVRDFWAQTGAILVVDEAPAQAAVSNMHRGLLEPLNAAIASLSSQCNSTGVKRGKSIWAIGPEFIAANMVQHGKSFCKTGSLTHVFIHPASQSEWNGQRLVFDTSLFKQLTTNFQTAILDPGNAELCDRAVQIEGRFYSLDGLTLPDWDGRKCVAAKVEKVRGVAESSDYVVAEKVRTEPRKPEAIEPSENPIESVMKKIAVKVKASGSEGITKRDINAALSKGQREHLEAALKALLTCYSDHYRFDPESGRIFLKG
jgi:hypothetical protein